MRTFVAIDLSPELKTALEVLIRNLRKGHNARGIKWIGPSGMHLTLKFLGSIAPEKVDEITNFLMEVTKKTSPFKLRLKGTGTFPPGWKRSARVLWAGIEEQPELKSLQEDLEAGFERLGFFRENRPFHPHLTLGRVKSADGLEPVLTALEKFRDVEFGAMTVSRLVFFESVLKHEGAQYSPIAEVDFS